MTRRPPMSFEEGQTRARFLMALRDKISAELTGYENGTLVVLNDGSPRTAVEVAECLGVTHQGANNYLSALWKAGIITRDRVTLAGGGRQYTYRIAEDGDELASEQGTAEVAHAA